MYVADGHCDCDQVWWKDQNGVTTTNAILPFVGKMGTDWFFTRHVISDHNQSGPDIRIVLH
jgi:hypothetical protein